MTHPPAGGFGVTGLCDFFFPLPSGFGFGIVIESHRIYNQNTREGYILGLYNAYWCCSFFVWSQAKPSRKFAAWAITPASALF